MKFTALDAIELGYHVFVIEDGCRGVEKQAGDIENACKEMREAGVEFVLSSDLVK